MKFCPFVALTLCRFILCCFTLFRVFHRLSFDPRLLEPRLFDLRSFDPRSFDPRLFDPMNILENIELFTLKSVFNHSRVDFYFLPLLDKRTIIDISKIYKRCSIYSKALMSY